MKKVIKWLLSLLGNDFVKQILVAQLDPILKRFVLWLLGKLGTKIGHLTIYTEIRSFLLNISVADFLTEEKETIEKLCNDCINDKLK